MVAIASAQKLSDQDSGIASIDASNNGFRLAFITAAIVTAIGAILAVMAIRKPNRPVGRDKEEVVAPTG